MFRLYLRLACAIGLTLAADLGRAADTGYQVFDLGVLDGTISSSALGINNHGQVVGQAAGENVLLPTAFLWSESTGMQSLSADLPDSLRSIAYGINDAASSQAKSGTPFSVFVRSLSTPRRVMCRSESLKAVTAATRERSTVAGKSRDAATT